MKYGFDFNNFLTVSLNRASKVDSTFETRKYKAFYGSVNKMLLSAGPGDPQVVFDYSNEKEYGLFLFYKGGQSFYTLIINSKRPFDAKHLIKIFNLP